MLQSKAWVPTSVPLLQESIKSSWLANPHRTNTPGQNRTSSGNGKLRGLRKEKEAALGFLRIGRA